ncbi:DgyrCDS3836 [Dimorphilus gyrociliatus]|uniref:DgyrCDS3836 n=1 Tax=Dimorphilus gyrociliatus TaxID=2664684 RepID=A0A7I8VEJ2_9ANNE|nr:DgyrCDS3836 [Dimorphilus gyrociliatus]
MPEITGLYSYISTIDWTEPWLIGLIAFHFGAVILTRLTKRDGLARFSLFFIYLILVYFAENVNKWAAANWKLFSKEQYFDSNGLFISITFSGPLLMHAMIIVVVWLYTTSGMLVSLGRAKVKAKAEKTEKTEKTEKSEKTE